MTRSKPIFRLLVVAVAAMTFSYALGRQLASSTRIQEILEASAPSSVYVVRSEKFVDDSVVDTYAQTIERSLLRSDLMSHVARSQSCVHYELEIDSNKYTVVRIRRLDAAMYALHPRVRVRGRKPGVNERAVLIGAQLQGKLRNYQLGQEIRIGKSKWPVVGIIEAPGTIFESEVWGDFDGFRAAFPHRDSHETELVLGVRDLSTVRQFISARWGDAALFRERASLQESLLGVQQTIFLRFSTLCFLGLVLVASIIWTVGFGSSGVHSELPYLGVAMLAGVGAGLSVQLSVWNLRIPMIPYGSVLVAPVTVDVVTVVVVLTASTALLAVALIGSRMARSLLRWLGRFPSRARVLVGATACFLLSTSVNLLAMPVSLLIRQHLLADDAWSSKPHLKIMFQHPFVGRFSALGAKRMSDAIIEKYFPEDESAKEMVSGHGPFVHVNDVPVFAMYYGNFYQPTRSSFLGDEADRIIGEFMKTPNGALVSTRYAADQLGWKTGDRTYIPTKRGPLNVIVVGVLDKGVYQPRVVVHARHASSVLEGDAVTVFRTPRPTLPRNDYLDFLEALENANSEPVQFFYESYYDQMHIQAYASAYVMRWVAWSLPFGGAIALLMFGVFAKSRFRTKANRDGLSWYSVAFSVLVLAIAGLAAALSIHHYFGPSGINNLGVLIGNPVWISAPFLAKLVVSEVAVALIFQVAFGWIRPRIA